MPTYKIRGLDVDFPYKAYDCQLVYMEKVIQSLQNKCNALLESPTGTGKTLCLLCATLAWRKSLGGFSTGKNSRRSQDGGGKHSEDMSSQSDTPNLPPIIYTSRTHSQLRQVIKELKRSNYRPKMVVLGSREQLCIHEEVSLLRGRAQTNACHSLCKKRRKRYCAHFSRVTEFVSKNPELGEEPIDIEDLVNYGKTSGACPYYMSRDLHKVVDILFAPYNYLIDPGNRRSLSIQWSNSILIFDEAHNLEGLCADAASFDLSSGLLTACISEAKNCVDLSVARRDNSNDKSCNPDNFAILRALLLKLEKRISEIDINSKEFGFTKPGPYIYDLLADLNVTHKTSTMLIDIIEEATLLLEEDTNASDNGAQQKTKGAVCRLESIGNILKLIFRDGGTSHANYYRVHVQEVHSNASDSFGGKPSRILSWWCFNPGIALEEFSRLGVGSIILTSGTLSPMDSFAEELKLDFPIRLENPHVISENQIWAGAVPVGPSGYSFNSSYRTRDSPEYKLELGNAIVNFARIVPDGLLVFFPSYYLMDQLIGYWKNMNHPNATNSSTIWERICKHKLPVIEPRQASLFPLAIDDFMAKLKDTSCSGSVFFAVCRGKVSEGLDFADHAGRAVVITGLPFATTTDPKVRLKREFLDEQAVAMTQRTGCKVLTGEEWYNQQASRAVNQAVGRVIRHRHDYGAIIFCDERFTNANRQSQISVWIQPHIKCYSRFGDVVFTLTRFFRNGKSLDPPKLQLESTEDRLSFSENVKERDSIQSVDKLPLEKLLAPLGTTKDPTCSESLSTSCDVKPHNFPVQLREIPPANRCYLPSNKHQKTTLKHPSDIFYDEKKVSIAGKRNMERSKCTVVGLTESEFQDEKSVEKLIASCSSKKAKFVKTDDDLCRQSKNSHEPKSAVSISLLSNHMVKQERLEMSEIMQNAPNGLAMLPEGAATAQKKTLQLSSQNNKSPLSSPAPCGDEEKKGSNFLNQVKEKLTDAEYKEFVGYMRALKSKAEKIGHVLQSIARLFSAPGRLPLLQRFKDYVPAKYRPLYEQYLK